MPSQFSLQHSCYSSLTLWVTPTADIPKGALKISITCKQRDSDKESNTWRLAEALVQFTKYFQVTERQVLF